MSPKVASAVAILLAASPVNVVGFSPTSTLLKHHHASSSSLYMAAAQHAAEDAYPQLLDHASVCANSESCSIDSAELYLKEIVHVQSGCAAGTLSGNGACDDVLRVSEVVANLRMKISRGATRDVRTFWDNAGLYAVAALAVAALGSNTIDSTAGSVVPFTPEEIYWSIRDGYAFDTASHFFHNGGLLVDDPVASSVGASLTSQELMWSVRDGYASEAMFSGGVGGESVPFGPQEVWWAVRDGYATDMVGHWLRNGGLSM